ncbi:unnamed protein product [Cylindrotheca closterium]|uniref:Hexose transporter 1 n=1 Tax=Cylindrotheca closterium TaxID=2856 RepID=A0AAD2CDQ2_9STRA|nr:unnamed protein product [Cylindrotheca closterium]
MDDPAASKKQPASSSADSSAIYTTITTTPTANLSINVLGLALVCVTPMALGFVYGFDIGSTSFVLALLLKAGGADGGGGSEIVWWSHLTSLQQGLFVSALSLGALIGSHLMILEWCTKNIGRRLELQVAAALYLVGSMINIASGTLLQSSHNEFGFCALFLGRTLFGIGVGLVMHGAPAYLAEMCPPQIRGAVVSAKETVIVSGIVVGYAVGNWISASTSSSSSSSSSYSQQQEGHLASWTQIYVFKVVLLEVPFFLLTFCIPRSMRWLIYNGYRKEAEQSMRFLYKSSSNSSSTTTTNDSSNNNNKDDDISVAFDKLAKQIEETTEASSPSPSFSNEQANNMSNLLSKENRPALVASMGLIVFQQVSGQPSLLSYTTLLFEQAGWGGNASVLTSIFMMCMSTSTVLFVDKVGRKPLLKLCCCVMMGASLVLCICYWYMTTAAASNTAASNATLDNTVEMTELSSRFRWIVLIAVFLYIGGYQIGFGPLTWCIASEVFPLSIRGKAMALGVEVNYLLSFLVVFVLPILQTALGWAPIFAVFSCLSALGYWFVDHYVPETKGLTLEQIQKKLLPERMASINSLDHDHDDDDESPSETTRLIPT